MRNSDLHCAPQLVGIINRVQHKQTQNDTLEVPTQLRRQIVCQVLQRVEGGLVKPMH